MSLSDEKFHQYWLILEAAGLMGKLPDSTLVKKEIHWTTDANWKAFVKTWISTEKNNPKIVDMKQALNALNPTDRSTIYQSGSLGAMTENAAVHGLCTASWLDNNRTLVMCNKPLDRFGSPDPWLCDEHYEKMQESRIQLKEFYKLKGEAARENRYNRKSDQIKLDKLIEKSKLNFETGIPVPNVIEEDDDLPF